MATNNIETPKDTNYPNTDPMQKLSVISVVCRICYDNDKEEALIAPCQCKGTVAFVHRSCLETWLAESNTTKCELCHQIIKTERTPKYNSAASVWHWCWYSPKVMGHTVRSDIAACSLITPLAIIITYVCLFSSEYYNQQRFNNVPAARWTSISLLVMIAIMLIGYYLWVYSVIRINARMWYNWWQRACVVRYIPSSAVNLNSPGGTHIADTPNNTPNSILPNKIVHSEPDSEEETFTRNVNLNSGPEENAMSAQDMVKIILEDIEESIRENLTRGRDESAGESSSGHADSIV